MGILLDKVKELSSIRHKPYIQTRKIVQKHLDDIVEARRRGYSMRQIADILGDLEGQKISEQSIFYNIHNLKNLTRI